MRYSNSKTVNVGLLGLGTVGCGVAKILIEESERIGRKIGSKIVLKKICEKNLKAKRFYHPPKALLTTETNDLIKDPDIDILVELIGGIHPAKEIIEAALKAGKHVVTANKALLAEEGQSLFLTAQKRGRLIGMEASVCGGIPIIKAISEGLIANEILHFFGIVNGTCNYILTQMSEEGLDFDKALGQAQAQGFAEKNPALDIDGFDSAHKLALLAKLSFGAETALDKISVTGIRGLSIQDIEYAKELGYAIRLLAIGKKSRGGIELRVHPTMLPFNHPLSSVRGVYNAVFIHPNHTGDQLYYGKGAGTFPTASAVVSDIVDITKKSSCQPGACCCGEPAASQNRISPMGEISSKYYLRFQVEDKPGVLGKIANVLGKNGISILSVHQKESHESKSVPVIILTYEAREKNLRKALDAIDRLGVTKQKTVMYHVEK